MIVKQLTASYNNLEFADSHSSILNEFATRSTALYLLN